MQLYVFTFHFQHAFHSSMSFDWKIVSCNESHAKSYIREHFEGVSMYYFRCIEKRKVNSDEVTFALTYPFKTGVI